MSDLFAGCLGEDPKARCVLVGLPDDSQSSYELGCAAGPDAMRQAYNERCYNACTELGVDLTGAVWDAGNWPSAATFTETKETYRTRAEELLQNGQVPFYVGGDHAVSVPVAAAMAVLERPVHVVQVDAHGDLYPDFDGSLDSHACSAARLLEMDHVASLTQLGVRTLNQTQRDQLLKHGDRVVVHEARALTGALELPHLRGQPVYLTIDLDGFDPSVAPGVSHPVPGGLTARQVLSLIQTVEWDWVGVDVVELNPRFDPHGQTAVLAGTLLHEAMGRCH